MDVKHFKTVFLSVIHSLVFSSLRQEEDTLRLFAGFRKFVPSTGPIQGSRVPLFPTKTNTDLRSLKSADYRAEGKVLVEMKLGP